MSERGRASWSKAIEGRRGFAIGSCARAEELLDRVLHDERLHPHLLTDLTNVLRHLRIVRDELALQELHHQKR